MKAVYASDVRDTAKLAGVRAVAGERPRGSPDTRSPRPYDHARKVGNEGDLIKHAALTAAVCALMDGRRVFRYAESHAGQAEYVLQKGGEWNRGIGKFSRLAVLEADRQAMKDYEEAGMEPGQEPEAELSDALLMYDDVALDGRVLRAGMKYPGSSLLVHRIFENYVPEPKFHFWEKDAGAFASLLSRFGTCPNVRLHQSDGYEGVAGLDSASLVLVDPWAIDPEEQRKILKTLRILGSKAIPFLCWTPRLASDDSGQESADSKAFYKAATRDEHKVIRVSWPQSSGRLIGCQLTVSRGVLKVVRRTAFDVCLLMEWKLTCA
jgi:23S rRNA A2030 N6-methylase RlmJ